MDTVPAGNVKTELASKPLEGLTTKVEPSEIPGYVVPYDVIENGVAEGATMPKRCACKRQGTVSQNHKL